MTTIKDVARRAEVSLGTVSNVLNNVPTVNEAIRYRIMKAIKELNYRPNRIARSLISGHTQSLAFIIPDICNPFFSEMVRGATHGANSLGYSLYLGDTENNPKNEIEYIRNFVSQGVDGLIIVSSDHNTKQVNQLKAINIPIVIVDRELDGLKSDIVVVDNSQCARMAVSHLVESGYKRIGMILGPSQTTTAMLRLEGGKKVLLEKELFDEALVQFDAYTLESGYRIMQKYLSNGKTVDAVFCGNDMIAIGAIKAIEEKGYRVPEEIGIIGFDDIYLSSLIKPALTTIRQPTRELGTIAANMIIERICGTATRLPRKVILQGELIVRESTTKVLKHQ